MVSLEEATLPSIKKHVVHCKRCVDDTHAYIDPSKIEFVLEKLNSHHLPTFSSHTFLDILITRTGNNKLETTVFKKEITNLYINCNSPASI